MWLEHPRYVAARDRLVKDLTGPSRYRFRRLAPVIFLCGGWKSARRTNLRDYLVKHKSQPHIFFAEGVWDQIASQKELSALEMESALADLADMVLIVVESPGTFAELGAFSLSEDLRKKLLPIVDKRYKGSESFIVTGPLHWIDRESAFKPTIYVALDRVLESVNEIEDRFTRFPRPRQVKIDEIGSNLKHLLFFLCDLIGIIQPATVQMVQFYIDTICAPRPTTQRFSAEILLGLGAAMDLLRRDEVTIRSTKLAVYSTFSRESVSRPFHRKYLLDHKRARLDYVSVLQAIPEAKAALEQVNAKYAD